MNLTDTEACNKYRLPNELLPRFICDRHKNHPEFLDAAHRLCDSQIKWLLKRGWKIPEEN